MARLRIAVIGAGSWVKRSSAGTTMNGILEVDEGGLRVTLIKAVARATHRASQRAREVEV